MEADRFIRYGSTCTIMAVAQVSVLHVLTVTTILYFVMVAFWILKMEDFLKTREEEYGETAGEPNRTRDAEGSAR